MRRIFRTLLSLLLIGSFAAVTAGVMGRLQPVSAQENTPSSIYPSYFDLIGFDPTKYYIQPIKGLVGGERSVDTIRKDLLYQGYESYCAGPETTVDLQVDDAGAVENFLDQPVDSVTLNFDSTYTLDLSKGLIPLVRDTQRQQFQTSSIEEYFGYKDTYANEAGAAEVNSAPVNSLLSADQRCGQSVKILLAQKIMCDRLANPSECALYNRGIPDPVAPPDTDFTVKSLLDEYKEYIKAYVDPGGGYTNPAYIQTACHEIVKGVSTGGAFGTERLKKLQSGLANTPLYLDRSYRLAFLVAAIERVPKTNQLFNFFAGNNSGSGTTHDVAVLGFKVPDTLTNKAPNPVFNEGAADNSGSTYWEDSTMLTRNILVPQQQNISQDKTNPGYQLETMLQRKAWVDDSDNISPTEISCDGGATCTDELVKSLVDIINLQEPKCANTPPEYWSVISDPSNVQPPTTTDASRHYLTPFGGFVLDNLFKSALGGNFDRANLQIRSSIDVNSNTWRNKGEPTKIKFYLVYPVGYEYQKSIEALSGSFLTTTQLANANTSPEAKDYFEVGRNDSKLIPGTATHEFPTNCREKYDPVTGQWSEVCGTDQFTLSTLEQGTKSLRVLGARLGFWMRTIQKSLNRFMSGPYAFMNACTTTEDFLLGTCSGNLFSPGAEPATPLGTVGQCDMEGEAYAKMGRITSGETATHIYAAGSQCTVYDPAVHNIPDWKNPGDEGFSCDDLYNYVLCTFPDSLIQNPVDSNGKFVDHDTGMTACEYIVSNAKSKGISPQFALAMWGEESGFSHYKVPDFGVVSAPAQDLKAQLDLFADTANSHGSYQSFLEAYGVGQGNNFCVNPYFVGRLKTFYDYLD